VQSGSRVRLLSPRSRAGDCPLDIRTLIGKMGKVFSKGKRGVHPFTGPCRKSSARWGKNLCVVRHESGSGRLFRFSGYRRAQVLTGSRRAGDPGSGGKNQDTGRMDRTGYGPRGICGMVPCRIW
jgi:hypothetical protein